MVFRHVLPDTAHLLLNSYHLVLHLGQTYTMLYIDIIFSMTHVLVQLFKKLLQLEVEIL
jgi:hypothetical protein